VRSHAFGVKLVQGEVRRIAFRLTPHVVRTLVPRDAVGAYLLLRAGTSIYVGRSDTCVQHRLVAHPLLGVASHFAWEPCRSPALAFAMEAAWYHQFLAPARMLNLIHPARPVGYGRPCPFCEVMNVKALTRALQ
jgi:hypothetical protein